MDNQVLPRKLNLKYIALIIAGPKIGAAFSIGLSFLLGVCAYQLGHGVVGWPKWHALIVAGVAYFACTRVLHTVWLPLLGTLILTWVRFKFGPKTEHAVYHHWENKSDLGEKHPHKNMRAAVGAIARRLGEA